MPEFVHLHVHSEYSLRESPLRLSEAVDRAASLGMSALAVTDTNGLYGAIPFYNQARAAGVQPIVGVQLQVAPAEWLTEPGTSGRPSGAGAHTVYDTAVFLAEDWTGYQALVRLVTAAQQRIRRPVVSFTELAEASSHLLALVGGGESVVLRAFSRGAQDEAAWWLRQWQTHWPAARLYVDVQDHALAWERQGLPALVRWAREHGVPLVATNDVHYGRPEDADIQRILAQLDGGAALLEGTRYHLASPDEMWHRFAKLPEAARNTLVVAERCRFELPERRLLLPRYPTGGAPASAVLRRAAEAGVRQRYAQVTGAVRDRLEYELSVIERLGFSDYFLVVADFIRFAHKHGISTGPGRGSAASSLVAYALRITDIDPLRHKLLFERFLNPERVSWPDIDTDFEYERRGEVIQYVVERYGVDHVAQIGTFGTLAAKAALRDAGRAMKVDNRVVDQLARQVPSTPGMTLARALQEVDGLSRGLATSKEAKALWDIALRLEGLPRHTSTHAAGVLISPVPLTDLVPTRPGADGTPVTQYPMEVVEQLGLMKMDFLGLTTLTLIDRCLQSVEAHTGQRIDWRRVSTDDPATYAMLSRGEVSGCFQLESAGVRRVLRDLRPSRFDDLVAVISLYRPGPMENIPAFIAAKRGRAPIVYPHPDLEPILQDTYGVIVYQEQIMQIAARMAGFSLGQADLLRRAVGKKQRDVLDAERARFVAGCVDKGYARDVAEHVYDLIVRFADYGFPLSHAAAYSVLTFRTAYLRAHWFPHFMAALLSMHLGDDRKCDTYRKDAEQRGVHVLPPSVSQSGMEYTVDADGNIRTGLLAVRGVGRAAVEAILTARAAQPFASLADFLRRVNSRACNRRAVEGLLVAGALAEFLPELSSAAVRLQLLEEAYREVEAGGATAGLDLVFDSTCDREPRFGSAVAPDTDLPDVLYIRYDPRNTETRTLEAVRRTLRLYPGDTRVVLYNQADGGVRLLHPSWSVALGPELVSALEELVGVGSVKVGRQPPGVSE
ncbi:MAG: DNA polymerase III subunit alpha [Alicyclobacillus sp.]|nr:DNA polymerase III subunit alpha [Alicyclobacillus sp.]